MYKINSKAEYPKQFSCHYCSMIGAMKYFLLGLTLLGINLITIKGATSITFLAEKSKLHVETSVKGSRVSLKATTEANITWVRQQFLTLTTLISFYKALPYLQVGSTLLDKYGSALEPGENHLKSSTKLYTHLFSFMDSSKNIPVKSSCVLEYPLIDSSILTEGAKFLQTKSLELSGVTTDVAMKADSTKMASLSNFITAFNSVCADWHNQISNIISEMDVLDGLVFPEGLKGKLETVSCLNGNGFEFEQITVLSSTPISTGLIIELDVGTPSSLKEMVHLIPIAYEGICLKGESDHIYFARESATNVVKLLN